MVRDIVIDPDSRLRHLAKVVTDKKEIARVLRDLKDTMIAAGGVGLAANQISEMANICIYLDEKQRIVELINPIIMMKFEKFFNVESCLSIPGYTAIIPRALKANVGFRDRDGEPKLLKVEGEVAARVQHEVDHLNGILIRDYVENVNGVSGGMDETKGPQ